MMGERWMPQLNRETGKRGAYAGAVKIGSPHHALRARTQLGQAEFAQLAGVSERTVRTWDAGGKVSAATHAAIVAALARCGVFYPGAGRPGRAVRYRCPETGATWSGRGLKPAWLRLALDRGRRLAEFELKG